MEEGLLRKARIRGSHHSQRIPALDGVRGLAILLVLVFHFTIYGGWQPSGFSERAYYALASGGWIGVDLFFVLSGFLITGILFDTRESTTFFRSFYARRILRIFPLYYAVLAIFFILIPLFVDLGTAFRQFQAGQGWYWSYLVNVKVALADWGEFYHLGHFWSLAVEEQFYLLWPLVVFTFSRRTLVKICYAAFVGAFLLRIGFANLDFSIQGHPVPGHGLLPAYVLMPSRMDALAAGALVALYRRDPGRTETLGGSLAVLALSGSILVGMLLHLRGFPPVEKTISTFGYSALAAFFAAAINVILASPEKGVLDRALSIPGLRFLGRYSYALYVIHHPVVLWMRDTPLAVSRLPILFGSQLPAQALYFLLCLGISLGLALLSWRFLETPFLRMKHRFPYGQAAAGPHSPQEEVRLPGQRSDPPQPTGSRSSWDRPRDREPVPDDRELSRPLENRVVSQAGDTYTVD